MYFKAISQAHFFLHQYHRRAKLSNIVYCIQNTLDKDFVGMFSYLRNPKFKHLVIMTISRFGNKKGGKLASLRTSS